ncbi:hypothetical protein D5R81_04745 [Parashewanella spongiae]|uniref:Uncharacterized protein n=1 Tax=Parashewanella spongiae TaxID=342950 RepID=A0A3A6TR63_9GAMM|nr:hypothetical protein [Parashewanella spongiae]MCL1077295.1 hypothetical protein [Parashewanella spongiae]RJY18527.1 hypothetical protein D5R81_04745 [Parashewanella spongiae]
MKLYKNLTLSVLTLAFLAGCKSTPPSQTQATKVSNRASSALIAKSAYDFRDDDIVVPSYFDTQGLDNCTFNPNTENEGCPLKKPIVRMYFDVAGVSGEGEGVKALREFDDHNLLKMLENQFAGINRFRIVTRDDDTVSKEQKIFLEQQGAKALAKKVASQRVLQPDFVVKLDSLRTVKSEGSITSWMDYTLEITSSVLNPYTREKLSHPNLGKIRVKSEDVRERSEMKYIKASNRYVSGYRYFDAAHVNAVLNDMASRGIDILLTRMLSEMPATAQVLGIKGDQISLDRGQNAGVLKNETMIIFSYEAGFVEPIGVASVSPSKNSANGKIIRWKNSSEAEKIERQAKNGIYRPSNGAKIFAVSVGAPKNFLENRT